MSDHGTSEKDVASKSVAVAAQAAAPVAWMYVSSDPPHIVNIELAKHRWSEVSPPWSESPLYAAHPPVAAHPAPAEGVLQLLIAGGFVDRNKYEQALSIVRSWAAPQPVIRSAEQERVIAEMRGYRDGLDGPDVIADWADRLQAARAVLPASVA